jgi:hypothetical protein
MPIEYFLTVHHTLINKHSHVSLPQVVSLVADSHKLPLIRGFTEGMCDIYDCVIQVDSQEGVREGEAQSIVNLVVETKDLREVAIGALVEGVQAEPGLEGKHNWEEGAFSG